MRLVARLKSCHLSEPKDLRVRGGLRRSRFGNIRYSIPQDFSDEEIAVVEHIAHDVLGIARQGGEIGLVPAALPHVRGHSTIKAETPVSNFEMKRFQVPLLILIVVASFIPSGCNQANPAIKISNIFGYI